jgi:hypothetical protein
MRPTPIALFFALSAAPLAAQHPYGTLQTGGSATPSTSSVRDSHARDSHDRRGYGRSDRENWGYGFIDPRITMDSAAHLVQTKYTGWFVRSKVLTTECGMPIYVFGMIVAGQVGDHTIRVDGDTGQVLDPEDLGQPADSANSDFCLQRYRQYRTTVLEGRH